MSEATKVYVYLYNDETPYEAEIIDSTISKLMMVKRKISGNNDEIGEIDVEIARLCEQNNMYSTLKLRNCIDEISFIEKTSEIQRKITSLRQKRLQILNLDDDEKCIEELRNLKNTISGFPKALVSFDEYVFLSVVKKIYIKEDKTVQFELLSGICLGVKV